MLSCNLKKRRYLSAAVEDECHYEQEDQDESGAADGHQHPHAQDGLCVQQTHHQLTPEHVAFAQKTDR